MRVYGCRAVRGCDLCNTIGCGIHSNWEGGREILQETTSHTPAEMHRRYLQVSVCVCVCSFIRFCKCLVGHEPFVVGLL